MMVSLQTDRRISKILWGGALLVVIQLDLAGCYSRSDEIEAARDVTLAGQDYSTKQGEVNTLRARRDYFLGIGDSAAAAREGALLAKLEEQAAASKRRYESARARSSQVREGKMRDDNPLRWILGWLTKN